MFNTTRINITSIATGTIAVNCVVAFAVDIRVITSGDMQQNQNLFSVNAVSSRNIDTDIASAAGRFLLGGKSPHILASFSYTNPPANRVLFRCHMALRAQLASEAYRAYSIWGANSGAAGRVAISQNPLAIIDHVNSTDVNLPWRQAQSSASQVDVQSYQFHALFAERRPASEVFNEFGGTCGVNLWLGDCGMMNFRTYQGSASAVTDRTLTPDDYIEQTFSVEENPLGDDLVSDITLRYAFQYHLAAFDSTLRAFRGNTAACDSLDAAGVKNATVLQSEFIMNTDTASFWLGRLVRQYAQGSVITSARLPFRYCDLELFDVLRLQHPILQNSASTYQITELSIHPIEGWVQFKAMELR